MKLDAKQLVKPIVVLTVICVVAGSLLAATDALTRARIDAVDAANKAKAMSVVFETADEFSDEAESGDFTYSKAFSKGEYLGCAVSTTVQGYGGDIDVMVGVNKDGSINHITILKADDETPGLGQNTKKPAFLSQFDGKSGSLTVVKGAASGDDEIAAVTSATISSKAVTKAVNNCVEFFAKEGLENG